MGRPKSTSKRVPPSSDPGWAGRAQVVEAMIIAGPAEGMSWLALESARKRGRVATDLFLSALAWLETQGRVTCLFDRLPPLKSQKDGHSRKGNIDLSTIRWVLRAVPSSPRGPNPDP